MSDLLQNLLTEPHAALESDADFRTAGGDPMVDFIIEDKGDVATQISKALNQGTGLACLIDLVSGTDDAPDSTVVVLNPIMIVCDLSEKVITNRKGSPGEDYLMLRQALAMIMTKLKNFTYTSNTALVFESFKSVPPPKGADAGYQLYFTTTKALKET